MQSSLTVITPAQDISLVPLYEAKLGMNLASSTDTTLDEQLELLIEWASAEIAALCNRTFAQETVTETFDGSWNSNQIFLSRYPVTTITAFTEDDVNMVLDEHYQIDKQSGLLTRIDDVWTAPVSITYTGGYSLPNDSPKALRQAATLLTREAYYATTRGDASIRMVAHKESRVIYFDPNAKGGSSAGSATRRSVNALLQKFTRFYI